MSEIGSGNPTDWPTAQDTNTTKESGATQATSNFANDVADRIIKIMNILGNDPHGGPSGASDVAARIGQEHTLPGAHTTAAPANVIKQTASAGSGTTVSRANHLHDVTVATPTNVTKAANAEGSATSLSRSDHKHDVTTANVGNTGTANAEGSAASLARSDHVHNTVVASSSIGTGELKTATAVTTMTVTTDITMNDYSFFPSVTSAGNAWAFQRLLGSDPANTVGAFRMAVGSGTLTVRWRYMTASDNPTVWASFGPTGKILAVWMSDDPTPEGSPGVVAYDATGKIKQKSILIPRIDLGKLLTGISAVKIRAGKKLATTPDKEPYRIMWEAFKNPADEVMKRAKIVGGKLVAK
ncbi:MAG: hypothetical protein IIB56_09695 [Planctomycetes bacterium]|nr:hypothetical protein [Planctomycetota bacterium]